MKQTITFHLCNVHNSWNSHVYNTWSIHTAVAYSSFEHDLFEDDDHQLVPVCRWGLILRWSRHRRTALQMNQVPSQAARLAGVRFSFCCAACHSLLMITLLCVCMLPTVASSPELFLFFVICIALLCHFQLFHQTFISAVPSDLHFSCSIIPSFLLFHHAFISVVPSYLHFSSIIQLFHQTFISVPSYSCSIRPSFQHHHTFILAVRCLFSAVSSDLHFSCSIIHHTFISASSHFTASLLVLLLTHSKHFGTNHSTPI